MSSSIRQLFMILLGCMALGSCANQNALLQSPSANSTDSIDQINSELDLALKPEVAPAEIPASISAALTPELLPSVRKANAEARFDLAVNQVPAQDFFAGLVEGTHRNMVVHPEVTGSITLTLKNVTIPEVMEISKDIFGYEYETKGNLIKVYPLGLRTQIFEINYLNVKRGGSSETRVSSGQITNRSDSGGSGNSNSASSSNSSGNSSGSGSGGQSSGSGTQIMTSGDSDFWKSLEQTLLLIVGDKAGRSVVVTPQAGVVVVKASAEELTAIGNYLQRSELIMQRQVILEAKILEVELNEGYQQGINWNFNETSGLDSSGQPKRIGDLGVISKALVAGNSGGIFASTVHLGNFNTTIELLGTQGNVQVLSSPRIATVNNQKAVIKVGSDQYFVTDINFESNNESDSNSTDIELTPFFSGIALDVTPQISDEGNIILHVHPTISKVDDQQKIINVGDQQLELPLAFSTIRESDSVITAENRQIVVIGGLIQNRSEDANASVPFLGDLPLIGELFKQKRQSSAKTELVILLRATITDDKVFGDDIRSSRDRFGRFRDSMVQPTETNFYE